MSDEKSTAADMIKRIPPDSVGFIAVARGWQCDTTRDQQLLNAALDRLEALAAQSDSQRFEIDSVCHARDTLRSQLAFSEQERGNFRDRYLEIADRFKAERQQHEALKALWREYQLAVKNLDIPKSQKLVRQIDEICRK